MNRLYWMFCWATRKAVLLAFECKRQPTDEELIEAAEQLELLKYKSHNDCGNPLCGKWRWVETSAPLAPPYDHRTPETTGRRQALCLFHDSTWRWILDGKLIDTGWYTTARKVSRYYAWGKTVEEPYDEILFFSRNRAPIDLSSYSKDGFRYMGGSGHAYYVDASKLRLGSAPGGDGGHGIFGKNYRQLFV